MSNIDQIRQFQITRMAHKVLKGFINALEGEPETAWSITGPYGTGKSSFCNFLFALCGGPNSKMRKAAFENLGQRDATLLQKFVTAKRNITGQKGFLHLRAVSRYESINNTLVRGLYDALYGSQEDGTAPLLSKISELKKSDSIQTVEVLDLLSLAAEQTGKKVLIVVDEFGKNLEFMSHNPSVGDIFILQALAESRFAYLWVCLHQTFSDYAYSLSEIQRNEWQKVQGRFKDISYLEPPSHVVGLILKAIRHDPKKMAGLQPSLMQWAQTQKDLTAAVSIKGISDMAVDQIKRLYPFPPLSAIILGELSHRFAQNDRTIFSFLSSAAQNSFSDYLSSHRITTQGPVPSIRIDWLYDYFCEITTQTYGDRSSTQRWIEIQSLITKHKDAPKEELNLLKIIGVLNLLSHVPGIKASKSLIDAAMAGQANETPITQEVLNRLVDRKILLYRNYAAEYRLWEGTDFNLEKAVREERARLSLGTLENILQIAAPQPSIIAARHSFQTGAVREFKQTWTSLNSMEEREGSGLVPCKNSDGQIWLVLGKGSVPQTLIDKTKDTPVIIGYSPCETQVVELSLDAAAAKKVLQSHTQLSQDGVARREARFRAEAAEETLQRYLADIVGPTSSKIQWFACGNPVDITQRRGGLSSLASKVCDSTYSKCPGVNMEMINHDQLTSAAARAQRILMEAMVTSESQKDLGIEGFGPEKAIYLAMFQSTGLHRFNEEKNIWQLMAPDAGNNAQIKLYLVWEKLTAVLKEAEMQGQGWSLADLFKMLQKPPYGLRKGPIPIFLCHYILVNNDQVALYQEGAFLPFFGASEAALMVKRPDLFQLRWYSLEGGQREIVQAYMRVFDTDLLEYEENARNISLVKIIGPLVEFMDALPDYSRYTRQVSQAAQKLRSAVIHSREPLALLFEEIPKAFGLSAVAKQNQSCVKTDLYTKLHGALIELADAFKGLNDSVKESIQQAFDFGPPLTFEQFRKELQGRIATLEKPCKDKFLKTILKTMLNAHSDDDRWAAGIAGVITKKPIDSWRDSDLDPWYVEIQTVATRILAFEVLVKGNAGILDENRISFGLTRTNGTTDTLIVNVSSKRKERLLNQYPGIATMNDEDKKSLCAILLNELGNKDGE
ncbi:hypothetical protein [uncultured Desulfobacter sp.]|uniref:hypothetical protein n=1 Tax=uncultured Desulfobacter sp. TaxID=240139 RepID=UPI002AAC00D1|nr:hypothetical protein [uncultured Desulfobacter sp.]